MSPDSIVVHFDVFEYSSQHQIIGGIKRIRIEVDIYPTTVEAPFPTGSPFVSQSRFKGMTEAGTLPNISNSRFPVA